MIGNIYTDECCPVCGGALKNDENIDGFTCEKRCQKVIPEHMRVRYRNTSRRFSDYQYRPARQTLEGWRFKYGEKSFDERDYQKDSPLGFMNQAEKWLKTKAHLSPRYYRNLERWIDQAAESWGRHINIKSINYGHIEDLLLSLSVSDKTKSDMVNCYGQFFKWCEKREQKFVTPDLPHVKYTLGWRNIIDLDTQQAIIDEIERICPNRRIWIGIKWLATYVAIRPQEMWSLLENQIDVHGHFVLPPGSTKESEPKQIPMVEEDIEIYRSLPSGLPHLPFFRRHKGKGVSKPGEQISVKAFYRWWVKARNNLGIKNVDLYGGTRHSTVSAMGNYFTPGEIKQHGTQHKTNKAFDRYFRSNAAPKLDIYNKINEVRNRAKVVHKSSDHILSG